MGFSTLERHRGLKDMSSAKPRDMTNYSVLKSIAVGNDNRQKTAMHSFNYWYK